MVTVNSKGDKSNGFSSTASISSDGRYVAFSSSAANLVPGGTNSVVDVFVHDRLTGKTERVSISSSGKQQAFGGLNYSGGYDQISLSSNGRNVTFVS